MVREAMKTDEILHGVSASPLVTSRKDPSTFFGFCCGTGLARMGEDISRPHGHHTFCPVWEAEKKREWARKELMRAPRRPGLSPAAEAALSGIESGDALEEWMAEEKVRA
jgi:hypothetical protein